MTIKSKRLNNIFEATKVKTGRFQAWGMENLPTILTVTGCVLDLVGTVIACVQTTNLEELKKERDAKLDILDQDYKDHEVREKDYQIAVRETYFSWALAIGKNYALAAAVKGLGYACIGKGHAIMLSRCVSLGTLLNEALQREKRLEDRIREKYGDEALQELKKDDATGAVITYDKDGNATTEFIFDDSYDWDFVWKPGMKGFDEHDLQANLDKVVAIQRMGQYKQLYSSGCPVNWVYEQFGANDKVRSYNDAGCVGYPNYKAAIKELGADCHSPKPYELLIEATPRGVMVDGKSPWIDIHLVRKPISCLGMNINSGLFAS